MDQNKLLFQLLRSSIRGNPLSDRDKVLCTDEVLGELFGICKKHDVAHLLSLALESNHLCRPEFKNVKKEIALAIYRYEQLHYEFEALCETLEQEKIPFLPLKGSVLRHYYPKPWMRTSCDIDILVQDKDVDSTADHLIKHCGYTFEMKGPHDISLFSPGGMHLELHYDLVEDGIAKASSKVLESVWETALPRKGYVYWHEMLDAMFYFYHIAHMAKHFEEGGCGIRPLLDLWILDHMDQFDLSKRDSLLKQGELSVFAQTVRALSAVWFDDMAHTELTKQMESYILRGGVYGTVENRITVQQQKKGGRLKYAMYKIFLPYDVIKFHYPILQKHRWLTPIMQVRRWLKLLFGGHAKRSMRELKYNRNISQTEAANVQEFLNNIGL